MDSFFAQVERPEAAQRALFSFDARGVVVARNELALAMGWPLPDAQLRDRLELAFARRRRYPEQDIRFVHGIGLAAIDCLVCACESGSVEDCSMQLSIKPADRPGTAAAMPSHARWRYALNNAEDGLWDWSAETDRVFRSARSLAMLGYAPGDVPESTEAWQQLVHPQDREQQRTAIDEHLKGDTGNYRVEYRILHADGRWRWLLDRGKAIYWSPEGQPSRVVGTHTDITAYRELEQQLRDRETRLDEAMHDASDERRASEAARWRSKLLDRIAAMGRIGGFDLDLDSGVFQWTDENYRIHGIEPGTPVTLDTLTQRFDEDSRTRLTDAVARMVSGETSEETAEVEYLTHDERRLVLRVTAIIEHVDGKPRRVTGLTQDITQERAAGERIQQLAHFDVLTGLPNRFLFRERAEEAIRQAKRNKSLLAVLFIDLDRFKVVNDTLGHAAGDLLLQEVARRLSSCLRGRDLIGRQGGDEFMVMACEVRRVEDAARVAGKIIAAVGAPIQLGDAQVQVGCSIGIALLSENSGDLETLMRASDTAMYAAKDAGRNTFQFYNDAFFERVHRRGLLEQELRQALARKEFFLVYQPTVALGGRGAVIGIEALLRWQRPGDDLRSPLEFIPIAEDIGEIVPIGLWVLEEACRQARAWADAGVAFSSIAVNVSAVQLRDAQFAERVLAICAATGWEPRRLVLELTESALMRDTDVLRTTFATFEKHGINLSVDDFGTGFSNLLYLHRFPVQQLKIDRSFVSQMLSDVQVGVLTQAIVSLGHAMGLTVIAEGVESEDALQALRRLGCDEVQGYYLTRPLPATEMAAWIRARGAAPEAGDADALADGG